MTTVRPAKGPPLKKGPDNSQVNQSSTRRAPAWQNRTTPSPGPGYGQGAANRAPANGFPPLNAQANGKASTPNAWGSPEDKQQLLAGLAGSINQTITVSLRSNTRYEGTLTFVSPSASDDASLTLKNAKDLNSPNVPAKDSITIPASNVLSFAPGSSGPGTMKKVNETFRTDTEISRAGPGKRERELQAWKPDGSDATGPSGKFELSWGDDATFGPGASTDGGSWDQFAANERLFGVRTRFDEDAYTTPLDRSAEGYKERERRAEQLAAEITGGATNNPHVLEERGVADDSGVNEEDRYGAVVRGANAYVPPGARRQTSANDVPSATKPSDKEDTAKAETATAIPKLSVNAPDGSEKPVSRTGSTTASGTASKQPPADALPAFRDFVTHEKQRLTQKKQALVKNEMDKRVAELIKFGNSFKLNKAIPSDLLSIVAKDKEKRQQILEKSEKDAQSAQARAIGVSATVLNAAPQAAKSGLVSPKAADAARKQSVPPVSAKPSMSSSKSNAVVSGTPSASASSKQVAPSNGKIEPSKTMPRISMVIPSIPPFKGQRRQPAAVDGKAAPAGPSQPLSPTAQQRLNVNASSFRPNPKAPTFTPTSSSSPQTQAQTVSPKPAAAAPSTPNPFFGTMNLKKGLPVNVKEEFNPFRHSKVPEAKLITPQWPYNGKRYMSTFPAPVVVAPAPHPQASPHMAAHGPPPPPPPSYDEDAAAQAQAQAQAAAARGYTVYAYAPYYPGQHPQHLMPGMAGVPPNAFIPAPYMQPMPYPPNMPPPNGQPMYAPHHMGQMPPPQQYMGPPPPGTYGAPPPNSGGPRPSMPPTPIPTHAHPYYHQSPQLQHAMPYPMMMPPPGANGPPHPYEAGPPQPVQMGGVGHA